MNMPHTQKIFSRVPMRIKRPLDSSYAICIGANLQSEILRTARAGSSKGSIAIITDTHTRRLYGVPLLRVLQRLVPRTYLFAFPAGEKNKNQTTKTMLEHALLAKRCGRDTLIIALGGGVVGDMAGFIAATYCRGVPYIHIPTTLLAMVDSSIGGKTAIDTPYGKNMIGAFWQPQKVIIDIEYLRTLPRPQIISGLLEAVKLFITSGPSMLPVVSRFLDKANDRDLLAIITRAVQLKSRIVQHDTTEKGERMILNFGHTVGHALEHASAYRLSHGICVGMGILVESKVSELLGVLSHREYERIHDSMQRFDLPIDALTRFSPRALIATMHNDKKNRGGAIQCVLLQTMGKIYTKKRVFAHPVSDAIVTKAIHHFTK